MMTIDEAIRHCEEVAEEKESICNVIENKGETWTDSGKNYYDICKKCASEHRQLAKWLKELKKLRGFANFVAESVMEEDFEEDSDVYAEIFCKKLYKMGFIEAKDGTTLKEWLSSFNTDSAPQCFNAVQELKKKIK